MRKKETIAKFSFVTDISAKNNNTFEFWSANGLVGGNVVDQLKINFIKWVVSDCDEYYVMC